MTKQEKERNIETVLESPPHHPPSTPLKSPPVQEVGYPTGPMNPTAGQKVNARAREHCVRVGGFSQVAIWGKGEGERGRVNMGEGSFPGASTTGAKCRGREAPFVCEIPKVQLDGNTNWAKRWPGKIRVKQGLIRKGK